MKLCKICNEFKSHNPAAPKGTKATGFIGCVCWDCYLVRDAERTRVRRLDPAERLASIERSLRWARENPGKASSKTAKRRSAKLLRTPKWSPLDQIKQIYIMAAEMGKTVDHIYPLRGKLVSGLHVPWNLRIISKSANSSKGNSFTID